MPCYRPEHGLSLVRGSAVKIFWSFYVPLVQQQQLRECRYCVHVVSWLVFFYLIFFFPEGSNMNAIYMASLFVIIQTSSCISADVWIILRVRNKQAEIPKHSLVRVMLEQFLPNVTYIYHCILILTLFFVAFYCAEILLWCTTLYVWM